MQGQLMPTTGAKSTVVKPKDKTKSKPLARLKIKTWKSVVSF